VIALVTSVTGPGLLTLNGGTTVLETDPSLVFTPATPEKINTEAHPANNLLSDEILPTEPTGPPRTFSQRGPWLSDTEQTAARVYHAHHFNCHTCVAAGRGNRYDNRCALGLALWNTYLSG